MDKIVHNLHHIKASDIKTLFSRLAVKQQLLSSKSFLIVQNNGANSITVSMRTRMKAAYVHIRIIRNISRCTVPTQGYIVTGQSGESDNR